MIKKFKDFLKEGLNNYLLGPNKDDVWKSFGYDISFDTPTDFLNYITDDLKEIKNETHPLSVFLTKDEKILFEIDGKYDSLRVDYDDVWEIFEKVFGMMYTDIQTFIRDFFKRNLNISTKRIQHQSTLIDSAWWFNEKNHRNNVEKLNFYTKKKESEE